MKRGAINRLINLLTPFLLGWLVIACDQQQNTFSGSSESDSTKATSGNNTNDGSGNGAAPGESSLTDEDAEEIIKVEILHLIEPKIDDDDTGGTYTRKLTLPKNYNGKLYLAGNNVSTLKNEMVWVKFYLGKDRYPVEIPATTGTAAGLTPQTDVQVLIMDLRDKPFENINLFYDLYDYNNYSFLGSSAADALDSPVSSNRDKNLYCRGLLLSDDPSFEGDLTSGCTLATDTCKYAYAKVTDKTLVKQGSPATFDIPSSTSIQQNTSGGLDDDSDSIKINRCLPDDPAAGIYTYTYNALSATPAVTLTYGSGDSITYDSDTYEFEGPYYANDYSNWEITGDAILNSTSGVFGSLLDASEINSAVQSKLFPLYTQRELRSGIEYVGSDDIDDPDKTKTLLSMGSSTDSLWMDGCNERTASRDRRGEHSGSCNVTATIEIIIKDSEGNETVISSTDEVKLQLVKASTINSDGEDVSLGSFHICDSSSQCGSDECCFNGRCWTNDLVSQCIEDSPSYGNAATGSSCSTDFDCSSLCCDPNRKICQNHNPNNDNSPVSCSKPIGSYCITKEWCKKYTVTEYFIINTGIDEATGSNTCMLRAYTSQVYGNCSEGICVRPEDPEIPDFDSSDPNRCDEAQSAPQGYSSSD